MAFSCANRVHPRASGLSGEASRARLKFEAVSGLPRTIVCQTAAGHENQAKANTEATKREH